MGQSLSEPVTTKETSHCQNEKFRVASSCMQGWRITMEDSHTHILSLLDDPGTAFFGVYDGHGGARVSKYAGEYLHKFVVQRPEYKDNEIEIALKQGFLDIDHAMLHNESWVGQIVGSTAVVVLVKDNMLYCANAGDSRAIACVNGQVMALSEDHKPENELEMKRITEAGGWVENDRVNGNLALSRALGDFFYKRGKSKPEDQIVTAYPDVETRQITDDWEFILLACDGIWDVMTNRDVSDFCRYRIGKGMPPEDICEELMDHCLAPNCQMGCIGSDNMTVLLICMLNGKPYSDLIDRCKKEVETVYDDYETNNLSPYLFEDNLQENDIQDDDSDILLEDELQESEVLSEYLQENEIQDHFDIQPGDELQQNEDHSDILPKDKLQENEDHSDIVTDNLNPHLSEDELLENKVENILPNNVNPHLSEDKLQDNEIQDDSDIIPDDKLQENEMQENNSKTLSDDNLQENEAQDDHSNILPNNLIPVLSEDLQKNVMQEDHSDIFPNNLIPVLSEPDAKLQVNELQEDNSDILPDDKLQENEVQEDHSDILPNNLIPVLSEYPQEKVIQDHSDILPDGKLQENELQEDNTDILPDDKLQKNEVQEDQSDILPNIKELSMEDKLQENEGQDHADELSAESKIQSN